MKNYLNKVISWIKANKLLAFLIVVVLYLLLPRRTLLPQLLTSKSRNYGAGGIDYAGAPGMDLAVPGSLGGLGSSRGGVVPSYEAAPRPDVTDRKVITKSSMSLQVKDVRAVMEGIKKMTRSLGGYVVETDVTTPEFGESGSMVVRVPSKTLDSTLEYFRGLAVKVVSENISGNDITDQYIDIEERITRLEATKTRLDEIMAKAVTVEEILQVQRQIFSIQDQVDNYKGRLQYMDGASSTTLIRVYLSTDELGLPYTPTQAWKPQAVFKQATRSMLLNLIGIGNAAIWIAVYLPLIATGWLVFILIKKVVFKKKTPSQE